MVSVDGWDYEGNAYVLIIVYLMGFLAFSMGFLGCYQATRHKHTNENVPHVPEVTLIKYCTKLLRVICIGICACQLILFAHATSVPSTALNVPIYDSVNRPLAGMIMTTFGFATNFHPSFRHLFGAAMVGLIAFDTVSEVHYLSILMCAAKGIVCSPIAGVTTAELQNYMLRDFIAIVLELWALLQVAYLCLSVGCCFSRYTQRQLSITNPYSNVRDLLTKYHPEINFKHSV
ncbi:hypothetical protein THRCLA_11636 [Thraustotheca clavata]|uniref:Uncharacterized protein n=1 Tax=Thraustotheca clavata TaxID=74557 RepID=A0A1V9Y739_9STRA|nr:hypothetical protein THRCLA_11636 [Thraustotheca clavata]